MATIVFVCRCAAFCSDELRVSLPKPWIARSWLIRQRSERRRSVALEFETGTEATEQPLPPRSALATAGSCPAAGANQIRPATPSAARPPTVATRRRIPAIRCILNRPLEN